MANSVVLHQTSPPSQSLYVGGDVMANSVVLCQTLYHRASMLEVTLWLTV